MTINTTVDEILSGTEFGRRQSVGYMDVIPILGDDDDSFAPPSVDVSTSTYGTVDLKNNDSRPTIIPTGAGWVVKEAAQDHAIGSALILKPNSSAKITTARCIQQTQGGLISKAVHEMLVLPNYLRNIALSVRKQTGYDRLWEGITTFNRTYKISASGGHLEYFLKQFKKELDEFVAEFELVPNQVGAIVLVGDQIVGIERAPSYEFWATIWTPLIRISYGSIALKYAVIKSNEPTKSRVILNTSGTKSLDDLSKALQKSSKQSQDITDKIVKQTKANVLKSDVESNVGYAELFTVASDKYAGQYCMKRNKPVNYASIFARAL